jgi:hypothetical protein
MLNPPAVRIIHVALRLIGLFLPVAKPLFPAISADSILPGRSL